MIKMKCRRCGIELDPASLIFGVPDSDGSLTLDAIIAGLPDAVRLTHGRAVLEEGDNGSDPEKTPKRVSVVISFSDKGFGFGEVTIVETPRGRFLDTEHMSIERVKRYLCALVDGAVTDTDRDAANHRLYNEEMGRKCGPGCRVCNPGPSVRRARPRA